MRFYLYHIDDNVFIYDGFSGKLFLCPKTLILNKDNQLSCIVNNKETFVFLYKLVFIRPNYVSITNSSRLLLKPPKLQKYISKKNIYKRINLLIKSEIVKTKLFAINNENELLLKIKKKKLLNMIIQIISKNLRDNTREECKLCWSKYLCKNTGFINKHNCENNQIVVKKGLVYIGYLFLYLDKDYKHEFFKMMNEYLL